MCLCSVNPVVREKYRAVGSTPKMFSHFGNDDNSSYAGSIQSKYVQSRDSTARLSGLCMQMYDIYTALCTCLYSGYTTTNLDEAPSQIPDLSRPNAKSIYCKFCSLHFPEQMDLCVHFILTKIK